MNAIREISTWRVRRDRLKNVTREYQAYSVKRNYPIKYFVEYNVGEDFAPGQVFYRLEKTELVQSNKAILLMNKEDGQIYTGRKARELLGLPENQDVKVRAAASPRWEVYVQSNSANRVLPAGSKVLIRNS